MQNLRQVGFLALPRYLVDAADLCVPLTN